MAKSARKQKRADPTDPKTMPMTAPTHPKRPELLHEEDGLLKNRLSSLVFLDRSGPMGEWYQDIYLHREGFCVHYVKNSKAELTFLIDKSPTVRYSTESDLPAETLETVVKGAPLRLWLQLQEKFCLHASAIQVEDEALLLVGAKGQGKSTLAAYLHHRGHPIVCDDVAILNREDEKYHVQKTNDALRLKADAAIALNLPPLSAIFSDLDFAHEKYHYRLPLPDNGVSTLPLRCILLLEEREQIHLSPTPVKVAFPVLLQELLMKEVAQPQYLRFYFKELKEVLEKVPVYTLSRPKNWESLESTYQKLREL